MKPFLRNITFAGISLLTVLVIFGGGFMIGRGNSSTSIPNYLSGAVNATNEADFDIFWEVWDLINDRFISASTTSQVSEQDRVYGAIRGMVKSLGDPYTDFLLPVANAKFEESIHGEFSGVGMEVGIRDDYLVVIAPLKNTPAERAGLKSDDLILAIGGVPTLGLSIDESVSLIRGKIGTTVVLTVERGDSGDENSEVFDVEVVRENIHIPTLDTQIINGEVFVISLYNFGASSSLEFRRALREFIVFHKNKLILDLRGNPGGYLDTAVDIASWFLPAGRVVVIQDTGKEEKTFRSSGYNLFNDDLKMVILVDSGSASASEILAGALKYHNVAKIMGTNTFGKGSVQELITITPETSLKVTIAQWLTPGGQSISDGGLAPDVVIDETPNDEIDLYDFQMKTAVDFLTAQ